VELGEEYPRAPASKRPWPRNLRKRPAKPALGRGRLQRLARRAFLAEGDELSTTAILNWAYVRRRGSPLPLGLYWSLHRALEQIGAERIGRARSIGRPILWRLADISSATHD
jgi:hypothetical protein